MAAVAATGDSGTAARSRDGSHLPGTPGHLHAVRLPAPAPGAHRPGLRSGSGGGASAAALHFRGGADARGGARCRPACLELRGGSGGSGGGTARAPDRAAAP